MDGNRQEAMDYEAGLAAGSLKRLSERERERERERGREREREKHRGVGAGSGGAVPSPTLLLYMYGIDCICILIAIATRKHTVYAFIVVAGLEGDHFTGPSCSRRGRRRRSVVVRALCLLAGAGAEG